jgi:hypothetical protein
MTARSGPVGPVRVGDLAQMGDGLAQPRRIHPPGGLEQHGFGRQLDVVGELVGAVGNHLGVGGRDLAADQGRGGLGEGPPNRGRVVRTLPLASSALMRRRLRSQLAVERAC